MITKVSIDGAEPLAATLHIEWEMIDISTNLPISDPNWSTVDSRGHFHAYDQAAEGINRYPTLAERSRQVDCDGRCGDDPDECDGWYETWYECVICGEKVMPGRIPGPHYGSRPGLYTWSVEVQTAQPAPALGEKVSVRIFTETAERFGVALAISQRYAVLDGYTLNLLGVGPLGTRKAKI